MTRLSTLAVVLSIVCLHAATSAAQSSPLSQRITALQQQQATIAQSASRKLDNRVVRAYFTAVPLRDVIESLQAQAQVNIAVQWRTLEAVGVTPDMPVDVDLRNVPVRQLLRIALDKTGAGDLLTFYVEENVVVVTTKEAADAQMITKVYDVTDLLIVLNPIEVQSQEFGQVQQAGRGSAANPFTGTSSNSPEDLDDQQEELAEKLVELIQQTIRPEVWQSAGGQASVNIWQKRLIVTAPRSVHERLGGGL